MPAASAPHRWHQSNDTLPPWTIDGVNRMQIACARPSRPTFVAKGPLARAALRRGLPGCTLAAARFSASGSSCPLPPPPTLLLLPSLLLPALSWLRALCIVLWMECEYGWMPLPGPTSVADAEISEKVSPVSLGGALGRALGGALGPVVKLPGRLAWECAPLLLLPPPTR